MRCEDFREITDSFLSGELLVETNHEVVRHQENCESCRKELETQKMFRAKLRNAVINAPDVQINPAFAANLRSKLQKDFVNKDVQPNFWQTIFSLKVFATSAALILLTLTIGLVFLANSRKYEPVLQVKSIQTESTPNENLDAMWQKISDQAIGDHQHCGLEKMNKWKKDADKETAKKIDFRENILQKASFNATEPMKLLQVHDCIFDGRVFTHAIIQIGNRTVSVLLTESEPASKLNKNGEPDSTINCQKQTGFQVASFTGLNKAVFVISDLPEADNLNLARSLSNVMQS
ncbi:MAG: anti-sigma factor family protein [Pyrinomonadaceae bacterium]